jgi:hypothetical protein
LVGKGIRGDGFKLSVNPFGNALGHFRSGFVGLLAVFDRKHAWKY